MPLRFGKSVNYANMLRQTISGLNTLAVEHNLPQTLLFDDIKEKTYLDKGGCLIGERSLSERI